MEKKPWYKTVFAYVLLFGLFTAISLCLQSFIPFLQYLAGYDPERWSTFLQIFNSKFTLPMDIISSFWAAIAAAYVGMDRASFTIEAKKSGKHTQAFNDKQMKHLHEIMIMSGLLYVLAVALNIIVDADLSLTPLVTCFGAVMLSYVAGNKAITTMENACDKDNLIKELEEELEKGNKEDRIKDLEDQIEENRERRKKGKKGLLIKSEEKLEEPIEEEENL